MFNDARPPHTTEPKRPQEFCRYCSEKTPHVYERLAVNGRLASRATCLVCNNEQPRTRTD
jgi:ribosomal protein L44E